MRQKLFLWILCSSFFIISCSNVVPNANSNVISSIPIDVIILAGQSNATGFARSDQLLNQISYDESLELITGFKEQKIIVYLDNTIRNASPTIINFTNVRLGQGGDQFCFGLEIGLSYILNREQKEIIIIKYTAPGQIINFFVNENGLDNNFSDFIETSLQIIKKNGYLPTIKALCFMQGESDAIYYISANNYKKNLNILISNIRKRYGENIILIDAPITAWELFFPDNYQSIVNDAKLSVSLADSRNFLIDTTGLVKNPYDSTHYDAASEFELGKRMGQVFLNNYQ